MGQFRNFGSNIQKKEKTKIVQIFKTNCEIEELSIFFEEENLIWVPIVKN